MVRRLDPVVGRPGLASDDVWTGLAGPWVGLSTGFHFFYIFYSIYQGRRPIASVKVGLTMTFEQRRMRCSPRLSSFVCLD